MTFQEDYNAITADVKGKGKNLPIKAVEVHGTYTLDETLHVNPWVKINAISATVFDCSAIDAGFNVVIDGETSDTFQAPLLAAASMGACLNGLGGVIVLNGTDLESAADCLSIGNVGAQSHIARDIEVKNICVSGFKTGVTFNSDDTYLCKIMDARIQDCMVGLHVPQQEANNSGERHTIMNTVFGSCGQGLLIDNTGIEFNIINTSIDFCNKSALEFTDNAGFQKVSFSNCHLEGCNDEALVVSRAATDKQIHVDLVSTKVVPTNGLDPRRGSPVSGTRADGNSLPRTELFKGKMHLVINGMVIAYNNPSHDADNGFFLIDDDVYITDVRGVRFTGWRQAIAAKYAINRNWDFNAPLDGMDVDGWSFGSSSNISAALSTEQTFNGSDNSLKLTCTGASNWFVMESDAFNVNAGDEIMNQNAVYGGTSTGDLRVQWQLVEYEQDTDGDLHEVRVSDASGSDFKDLYEDANDPAYNADSRAMWYKEKTITYRPVQAGTTKAAIRMTIASLDDGDEVYLGAAFAQKVL